MKNILKSRESCTRAMGIIFLIEIALTCIGIFYANISGITLLLQMVLFIPTFFLVDRWINLYLDEEREEGLKSLDDLKQKYQEKEKDSLEETEIKFHQERERLKKEIDNLYK